MPERYPPPHEPRRRVDGLKVLAWTMYAAMSGLVVAAVYLTGTFPGALAACAAALIVPTCAVFAMAYPGTTREQISDDDWGEPPRSPPPPRR